MNAMLRPRDTVGNYTSPHSYLRVSASPRLRVSASPRPRVSASPRPRVSASPRPRVSPSPCLRVPPSPPRVPPSAPPAPRGFTLVEMMTVIVIIGILGSLITVAAYRARLAALRAVIKTEISQLQAALESYKSKYGEYPPDFANANPATNPINNVAGTAARTAVYRHLRKAFPRYPINAMTLAFTNQTSPASDPYYYQFLTFANDVSTNYPQNGTISKIDPTQFDAASALVFWLGGLPQNTAVSYVPAGFSANPAAPFQQSPPSQPNAPRTEPFFRFAAERLGGSTATSGPPSAVR